MRSQNTEAREVAGSATGSVYIWDNASAHLKQKIYFNAEIFHITSWFLSEERPQCWSSDGSERLRWQWTPRWTQVDDEGGVKSATWNSSSECLRSCYCRAGKYDAEQQSIDRHVDSQLVYLLERESANTSETYQIRRDVCSLSSDPVTPRQKRRKKKGVTTAGWLTGCRDAGVESGFYKM